jgi:signal transduction histidine kinase
MTAELLLRRGGLAAEDGRAIERVARSATRMDHLVRDIVDFTRARQGPGLPLVPASADLVAICTAVLEEVRASHPDRDLRLEVRGDHDGVWDPGRLQQAVSNLLGNALQHGAPDAPVTVTVSGQGEQRTVKVHNQGPPIPAEMLPHIFDPYHRGGPGGSPAGTSLGLGLYIVHEVVAAHGGTTTISSSAAEGTTVTVTFPRKTRV